MNKKILFLAGLMVMAHGVAMGAITIKKAAPVATQQTTGMDAASGLLPTVVNLVGGISQMNQQTQALTAECVPTTQEIADVNAMIKEWAKAGAISATEAFSSLGVPNCADTGSDYESLIRSFGEDLDEGLLCYDSFSATEDQNMIWHRYPKAARTFYCTDGGIDSCSEKNRVYRTNMYEIFALVDFSAPDYTASEAALEAKLKEKMEKCSPALLASKKKALVSEFVMGTISSVGQKTNTGSIMEMVSSVAGSSGGGLGGMLNSVSGVATQFLGGM